MCNWKSWPVSGLLAVAILTLAAALLRLPAVEADLSARALSALGERHGWATLTASGRDLGLAGTAPTPEAIAEAASIARSVAGVRVVAVSAEPLPLAEPFVLAVEWDGTSATLTGFAPDAGTRAALAEATRAALPDATIDDRLALARGAPEGFADLAAFAVARLAQLRRGRAELAGADLSVTGSARSPADYEAVVAASAAPPPGAGTVSFDIAPAAVSPFAWSIARRGETVVFDGFAPGAADREAFVAAARDRFPGLRLEGGLAVATGLAGGLDWRAAAQFMLDRLAGLSQGVVSVSDGRFSLDGRARDAAAHAELTAALAGDLPAGLVLAGVTLRHPLIDPYGWSLRLAPDGGVTLTGHAPDRETAARLAALVRDALGPDARLVDDQQIGDGAPEGFERALRAAVAGAVRLAGGRVELAGTRLTVSGEALTGPAANEVRRQLAAAMPAAFELLLQVGVRPVGPPVDDAECQRRLDEAVAGDTVQFEPGASAIAERSYPLLDRIAFIMRHCRDVTIEVGGHTDSDGSEEANLALSAERAASVVAYLARAGVLPGRLSVKGYGESVPIADNATEAGKQRNRRIEFRVAR